MLEAGWVKVFHPRRRRAPRARLRAARVHEALLRRVPRACARRAATWSRSGRALALREVARATLAGCDEQGMAPRERARWLARSAVHQGGRRVAVRARVARRAPAGSRAARAVARGPRRRGSRRAATRLPRGRRSRPSTHPYRGRAAPRPGRAPPRSTIPCPGMAERADARRRRDPAFERGSGGHNTIFTLLARLERARPHLLALAARPARRHARRGRAIRAAHRRGVRSAAARPYTCGFDDWNGADVVARHGLGHRVRRRCCCRLPRPRLPDPGPRAGVLRHLRRVALGGAHLRARPVRDRGEPLAARPARATATASAARGSGSAWTTTSTARGRWSAAATP